jgi:hypothetical protein
MNQIAYHPYLRKQLSLAFYAYLEIREEISNWIAVAMERNTPDYKIKNACPACTYTLEGEEELKYRILVAMDGNNSLKRVGRKKYERDDVGKLIRAEVIERNTGKEVNSDMFLSEAFVNNFKDEARSRRAEDAGDTMPGDHGDTSDRIPCVDTWKNLAADEKKKLGNYHRETGLFVTVCRHGICLIMCDMVRSGEL